VWWPGVSQQVRQAVEQCKECAKETSKRKEPLIITPLPEYPWQMVGADLFELNKDQYLLIVDYFSRYPEVIKLSSTTSAAVVNVMKSIFSRHGIPEIVRSDNGPQFSAEEFAKFANCFGFQHVTSSPRYPQSNGQVERMVQTMKRMIQKSDDPYLAIMSYRATPHPWCNLSPAELLMGRKMRTTIPQTKESLTPTWPYISEKNKQFKENQKRQFDQRHGVKHQGSIPDDTEVWVTSENRSIHGRVVSQASNPRSHVVQTPSGELQRNRTHLNIVPEQQMQTAGESQQTESAPLPPWKIVTRSQTGTAIKPTGEMDIKYGTVFMPYLPQRRHKHGKPRGLTRCRLYTVMRLFLTDLEDGIRQNIRSVPSIHVFFPVSYRRRHRTVAQNRHSGRLRGIDGVRRSPSLMDV
jgi:transposase InsO family protein